MVFGWDGEITELLYTPLRGLPLKLIGVVMGWDKLARSNNSILILATFVKEEMDSFCKEQEGIRVVTLRE